jgi:hypothetical protein
MENKKPIHTPLEFGLKLIKDQNLQLKEETDLMDVYKEVVRGLIFAITCTWLDITFVLISIFQHSNNPRPLH